MLENLAQEFLSNGNIHTAIILLHILREKRMYNMVILLGKKIYEIFQSAQILNEIALAYFHAGKKYDAFSCFQTILDAPIKNSQVAHIMNINMLSCLTPELIDSYTYYDTKKVSELCHKKFHPIPIITFTITTCKRYDLFSQTMNSFINCCTDIDKISRWICVDDNSSEEDRKKMQEKYPFFEFYFKTPEEKGHPRSMNILQKMVKTPYVFHMEDDWTFFIQKPYLQNCLDILSENPEFGQCLINRNYAELPEHIRYVGGHHQTTDENKRYILHEHAPTVEAQQKFYEKYGHKDNCAYWPHFSFRPSLLKTSVWKQLGPFDENVAHFEMVYARNYAQKKLQSVFLEGVYCKHTGRLTSEMNDPTKKNAYTLNNEAQFTDKKPTHILDKYNIQTFVINLDRRPDRWEKFLKQTTNQPEKHRINYTRYSAVDGSQLVSTPQLQRIFDGNDYNMKEGMVGCAMTHLKLYTELLQSKNNAFLIMEDDAELTDRFSEKLSGILQGLSTLNWDVCFLGYHVWTQFLTEEMQDRDTFNMKLEKYTATKSMQKSLGGTFGYLISKSGAKKFLEFINKTGMVNCIDTMLQKSADLLNVFYCTPHLVFSECIDHNSQADTDIQNNHSSLTVPIEIRFEEEKKFYEYYTVLRTADDCQNYAKNNNMIITAFYQGPNVQDLKKQCIHPSYILGKDILVIVPNPSEKVLTNRFFDRVKVKGEFNLENAIVYKVKK